METLFTKDTSSESINYCKSIIYLVDSPLHKTVVYTIKVKNFKKNVYETELYQYSQLLLQDALKTCKSKYDKVLIQTHINLEGLTMKKVDYKFIKKILLHFQSVEDDVLERLIITNIPVFFKVCYNVIKPFIHKDTKKKIYFEKKNNNTINYTNNDVELE